VPSWGIGMLYTHVRLLRDAGIDAFVLHDRYPFRPRWLSMNVPRVYLNRRLFRPLPEDIVVVPEVEACGNQKRPESSRRMAEIECRRLVFVQGSSLILRGLGGAKNYSELGYEGVIAVLPHIQAILQTHFEAGSVVIPPCIAPYFFAADFSSERKRQIVICHKQGSEDFPALSKFLRRRLPELGWRLLEIHGKTHRQVARIMKESALHISVNCQESFNATVPEAMAAGCVVICYEAFGPRDFLRDGRNAWVFPNHHLYPLLEHTLEIIRNYDRMRTPIAKMRKSGSATARRFTEQETQQALLRYFRPLLSI